MTRDEAVVRDFLGDFVAGDHWETDDLSKRSWFPKAGVAMSFREVKLKDSAGDTIGAYVRAQMDGGDAAEVMHQAIYRVEGDRLQARNIPLNSGLLLDETLELMRDEQQRPCGIRHILQFSDGTGGGWICARRPKGVMHAVN